MLSCQAPCDYIPKMSYPLLQAREVLRLLAEEGIEGSVKEVEPRGDRRLTGPTSSLFEYSNHPP